MKKKFSRVFFYLVNFIKKLPIIIKSLMVIVLAVCLVLIGAKIPSATKSKETVIDFGFKNVGKLITQEWYGRIVEDSSKNRKLFKSISLPFTESRLIFSIDVEILAGINFEDIKYNIDFDNKKVMVTVPHSEIYKSYEVKDSFISYLDEESWFSNINSSEQQALKDNIVSKGEKQAKESGLLEKADENARNIIKYVINGNEITKDFEVNFVYED